ncbi:lasso peptide biosynthesis B2 protein [Isoptericola croceus]|uniref:lasso peptide biosynthesis B2 protein n=1 Tax=Isoptericola croceus TaxID=3031406 RepID=UPI0023FA1D12|nr:lasso peptide biosynthesis B2 protein [Isoptericola croceus]
MRRSVAHSRRRISLGLGAVCRVVAVEVLLRVTRLPTTAQTMGSRLATPAEATSAGDTPLVLSADERRRLRAVGMVLRRSPFGSSCLQRALCAGHVLRERSPRLVIGVAKRDGLVSAHAWLVVDGVNLDPDGSSSFRPLHIDEEIVLA